MNMYWREIRYNLRATVIWTGSLIGVAILFMAIFPAFAKEGEEFTKLLEGYPSGVMQAFGVQLDTITSFLGFYSYIFMYITLCMAIQGMNLGLSSINKELNGKTAEFLLTKPVTRTQILTSKLLAIGTCVALTNLIYLLAVSIMAFWIADGFDYQVFLLISLTGLIVELVFVAIGVTLSIFVQKLKSVLAVSLGTVFGFFILNMFGSVIGEEAVKYITPFQYFNMPYIIEHASYEWEYVLLSIILIVVFISASFIQFSREDIRVM